MFAGNIPTSNVEKSGVNYPTPSDATPSISSWPRKPQAKHTSELPQHGIAPYHWHGSGDKLIDVGSPNGESEGLAIEPLKANIPSVLQELEACLIDFGPHTGLEWALDQQL